MQIFIGNDGNVYLLGLQNEASEAYVNNATVTCQLKNAAGTNVGDSISLSALGSEVSTIVNGRTYSDGNYRGDIPDDLDVDANTTYTAHVDATVGSVTAHWEIPVQAITRTS